MERPIPTTGGLVDRPADVRTRDRPRMAGGRLVPDVRRLQLAAIMAGGAAGALARAGLAHALPHAPGTWPWATFVANLAGTLVLGWSTTRLAERVAPTRYWRLLLGTGFCGALTTFSTFQVETIGLARDGHAGLAVAYAVVSLTLGMLCAIGGTLAARWGRYG